MKFKNKIYRSWLKAKLTVYLWVHNLIVKMTKQELRVLLTIPPAYGFDDCFFFFSWTNDKGKCISRITGIFSTYPNSIEDDDVDILHLVRTNRLLNINENVFSSLLELGMTKFNPYLNNGQSEYVCIFRLK